MATGLAAATAAHAVVPDPRGPGTTPAAGAPPVGPVSAGTAATASALAAAAAVRAAAVGAPAPAPAPSGPARRLAALQRLGVVQPATEPRFARAVRLARELFDVPTATVSLIGVDEPAHAPLPAPRDARPSGQPAAPRCSTLVVEDLLTDPVPVGVVPVDPSADGAAAPLRFYAEHPLVGPDGGRLGTLCVADTRPRRFTADQSALLRDLAHWVAKELAVDQELGQAAQVQAGLLPREVPAVPGYGVSGVCLPSRTVGGDFYDWYLTPDGLVVTLADVMGKGPAAAILAASVRAVLRGSAHGDDVDRAMLHAGAVLHTDLSGTGLFATAFHSRLDPATGRVRYADAGHGLTLVVRADGAWERLDALGLPLGVTDEPARDSAEVVLGPGDLLVTFSDGVLDLFDGSLSCVPLVAAELQGCATADEATARVLRLAATTSRPDDITVVAVRRDDA